MGGYDGALESISWHFEGCLGWRGILVEPEPRNFEQLLRARRSTLNLRVAGKPVSKQAVRQVGWRAVVRCVRGRVSIKD